MQTAEHPGAPPSAAPRGAAALAGAVAAGAALAAGELAAGLVGPLPSLVSGVATFVIDTVPPPVKDLAISLFGTNDKLALAIGIVAVVVALGAVLGARRGADGRVMGGVFVIFGLAGALASARSPLVAVAPALANGLISAASGLGAYRFLAVRSSRETDSGRRAFLIALGVVTGAAVLASWGGRVLIEKTRRMVAGRDEVRLPPAVEPVAAPPSSASLDVPGVSRLVTPNQEFYRIDTVPFSVPRVELTTWQLTIDGMVDRRVTLGFADLAEMPMIERYVTLSCVSNRVGGDLVGNAKWLGVRLPDLLDRAGVAPGAEQIVGRSVDGFTVGFPVEAAYDGRDALVAIGMNDEPLPFEHGFPARLVVAGLYGYVSATKWLSEIELTTWDGFDAYWVPRGWSKEGPIKTQSRIDRPRPREQLAAGPQTIAGVAWAPTRGISKVEVRIDEGEWEEAELAESLSADSWRLWKHGWDAAAGTHTIQVRATDGGGDTQTGELAPPAPDGATGWHTITAIVE